jgi:hypothetical protein
MGRRLRRRSPPARHRRRRNDERPWRQGLSEGAESFCVSAVTADGTSTPRCSVDPPLSPAGGVFRRQAGASHQMKATQALHDLGQSIWLDNIMRDLLDSDTLEHYIDELSVTGLTSNPTIFNHAIERSTAYDAAIRDRSRTGQTFEALFVELAIEDLTRAADLFRPVYDRTARVDGWVSLGIPIAGARYDRHCHISEATARAGRAVQPVHQDSWHEGRRRCHRGGDLRRSARQCHAPVLA